MGKVKKKKMLVKKKSGGLGRGEAVKEVYYGFCASGE